MFDWNDEEITDIIWGEAKERGDCIVPYPNGAANVNPDDENNGGFVDYEWANIGSFDDLDRIFCDDDTPTPVFGRESVSNAQELWSSSKDVTSSSDKSKSIPLPFDSPYFAAGGDQFEITSQHVLDHRPFGSGYEMMTSNDSTQNVTCGGESARGISKPLQREKGSRNNRLLKPRENLEEKSQVTWSPSRNQLRQFDSRYAPTLYPPLLKNQPRQLLGSESPQYKDFSRPFPASSMYSNMSTPYPQMAAFSQLLAGPQNMLSYAPLSMTPQEKIEKLRWRQQMRAMLAIQKQQQQFNNQIASTAPPNIKVANSSDDCLTEDSVLLHRLQDIIMKMDVRVRLCIRDSLFRLAHSATQRQFSSDNQDERNSPNRFVRIADVETRTNPVDRTVAQLLFHSPLESSPKHAERPVLLLPACERNEADLIMGFQPQSSRTKKMPFSHDNSKVSFLDISENA